MGYSSCTYCHGSGQIDDYSKPIQDGSYVKYGKKYCSFCGGTGQVYKEDPSPPKPAKPKQAPKSAQKKSSKSGGGCTTILVIIGVIVLIGYISNDSDEPKPTRTTTTTTVPKATPKSTQPKSDGKPLYDFNKPKVERPPTTYALENNSSLTQAQKERLLKAKTEQLAKQIRRAQWRELSSGSYNSMARFFEEVNSNDAKYMPRVRSVYTQQQYRAFLIGRYNMIEHTNKTGLPRGFIYHINAMQEITQKELDEASTLVDANRYLIEKEYQDYTVRWAAHFLCAGQILDPTMPN